MTEQREITRRMPLQEKVCPVCGSTFRGLSFQKQCSIRCSNQASYHRHAEARQKARRDRYARQKQQEAQTA